MKKIGVWLLAVLMLAMCLTPLAACGKKADDQLVLFTWADYFPQDVLDAFEKDTGIEIVYTYFDSNEEMLSKLQSAKGGDYDVILASDYILDIARREGLLSKLDKEQISNFKDIDPVFQGHFYDPDNEYTVPYAAGTPLIIYDPAKVSIDIKGYNDLWDASLKDSIVMMDDARNVMGVALWSMGESLNTTDEAKLRAAGDKLMQLKPNIRVLDYNLPHEKMISGEASVGYMFTPQVLWALSERPDLKVVYPEEGMGFGIDSCVVPVNAPHQENAFKFLNYILDGQVSAKLSEFTQYINCVTTAKEFLSKEYLENEVLYIPSEILGEAEFMEDIGAEATEVVDEIWVKFKQQ
nr:spermidine/putrescine ABC transporter substrate-binding protein [bacterium]